MWKRRRSGLTRKYDLYVRFHGSPSSYQLTPEITPFFDNMTIFTIGHDKAFRPIIYMSLSKIKNSQVDNFKHCLSYFALAVKKRMLRDYHIENWIIMLDLDDKSMLKLPFKAMRGLIETTSTLFAGSLHRLNILNPSFTFYGAWQIVSAFLDAAAREKVHVIGQGKEKELLKYIDRDQLLVKYGGTLKPPTRVFPLVTTFRPGETPEVDTTEETFVPPAPSPRKEALSHPNHLSPPPRAKQTSACVFRQCDLDSDVG